MKSVTFTIRNEEGLHARPATDFCEKAMSFHSKITVQKKGDEDSFEAKSILSVLCLGAVKGDAVVITADGDDEDAALNALVGVLESA